MFSALRQDHGKAIGVLCLIYAGLLLAVQLSFIADAQLFNDQHRPLFRYLSLQDPALFAGDYLASVARAYHQPLLYEWLTRTWVLAGGDLLALHRLLPLLCWLASLAGLAVAARRLGDWVFVAAVLAVAAAQPVYLNQITAATPHAFAFPLMFWGLAALLQGSTWGLVAVTLLSGLLYTATAPLLGLFLAWHLLVAEGFIRLPRRRQAVSLAILAVTGAAALWLVLTSLQSIDGLGAPLIPLQNAEAYPENGPEGQYTLSAIQPFMYILGSALRQFAVEAPLVALTLAVAYFAGVVYGLVTLSWGGAAGKAIAGFLLCSLVLAAAVYFAKPFHSYRYLLYPLYTIAPLLFVLGLRAACCRLATQARAQQALLLAALAGLALSLDSFDPEKAGYRFQLGAGEAEILAFAETTPKDSSFAVWPGIDSELELLPYLAERPLFVMQKLHDPAYVDHLLALRLRTFALIDAYLATEPAPLAQLYCHWGVDYLVVEKAHFAPGGERPAYFAPFDARIEAIYARTASETFLLQRPDPAWLALENAGYAVLDLGAVAQAAGCPETQPD